MYYLGLMLQMAAFVASLMVLVKLFQTKGALHGILGILSCGLYPFIWGWIHSKDMKLMKLMLLWTVGGLLGYGLILPTLKDQVMQGLQQAQQQAEQLQKQAEDAAKAAQQPQ